MPVVLASKAILDISSFNITFAYRDEWHLKHENVKIKLDLVLLYEIKFVLVKCCHY